MQLTESSQWKSGRVGNVQLELLLCAVSKALWFPMRPIHTALCPDSCALYPDSLNQTEYFPKVRGKSCVMCYMYEKAPLDDVQTWLHMRKLLNMLLINSPIYSSKFNRENDRWTDRLMISSHIYYLPFFMLLHICFVFVYYFSPPKFSSAGPFKSSIDCEPDLFSPTSPTGAATVHVPLENGAASQPIRTPARNKKQKGHRRWGGNVKRASFYCKTLVRLTCSVECNECWGKALKCFVFAGIVLCGGGGFAQKSVKSQINMWKRLVFFFLLVIFWKNHHSDNKYSKSYHTGFHRIEWGFHAFIFFGFIVLFSNVSHKALIYSFHKSALKVQSHCGTNMLNHDLHINIFYK